MIRRILSIALLALATASAGAADDPTGTITFVESVPVETTLDLPQVPNAPNVWLDLVRGAQQSLDIVTFYFSPAPDASGPLTPVLDAVVADARRGVHVRALSDKGFYKTYPETQDLLAATPNIEARLLDGRALWGGILHAKGMIVDDTRFYVGSQNWDWRALMHIHEFGALVDEPAMAAAMARVFDLDWALAGGETTPPVRQGVSDKPEFAPVHRLRLPDGRVCNAVLAADPPHALPPGVPWDLPLLVATIDAAQDTLRLQMLSYAPTERGGGYWPVLDDALRRAAARGVTVQLIFSNWAKRSYMCTPIQSVAVLAHIEVRFTNIPEWSGGFVPFARVEHAKYVTADGQRLWLGTSNGSRDYFEESRNLSLVLEGEGCTEAADAFFRRSWSSAYAETVDPCGHYEAPRRQ